MKAVDPSIKIGIVVTAPYNWPSFDFTGSDALDRNGKQQDGQPMQEWNPTVLKEACPDGKPAYDFVDMHWYPQQPGNESDEGLLNATQKGTSTSSNVADMINRLKTQVKDACPSIADTVQYALTETNSVASNPGKQTVSPINGIFLLQAYKAFIEAGFFNIDWWSFLGSVEVADRANPSQKNNFGLDLFGYVVINGNRQSIPWGDYGLYSQGKCADLEPTFCVDKYNAPDGFAYPSALTFQLLKIALGGPLTKNNSVQTLTTGGSNYGETETLPILKPDGTVNVLVINHSFDQSQTVNLTQPDTLGLQRDQDVKILGSYEANLYLKDNKLDKSTRTTKANGMTVNYTLPPLSAYVFSWSK
jgi:hypothetical protein